MTAHTSDNIQQWFSENAQQAHDHDTSESGRSHSHDHHHSGHHHHHHHDKDDFHDYMQAVADYKKTFSNKEKVIEQTPDPAVRELLLHMQELGVETVFENIPTCSSPSVRSVSPVSAAKTVIWVRARSLKNVGAASAVPTPM